MHRIRHFRNAKGTKAEMSSLIVSGMVIGDAPVSYRSFFSSVPCNNRSFTKVYWAQFPSRFLSGELSTMNQSELKVNVKRGKTHVTKSRITLAL